MSWHSVAVESRKLRGSALASVFKEQSIFHPINVKASVLFCIQMAKYTHTPIQNHLRDLHLCLFPKGQIVEIGENRKKKKRAHKYS